MDTLLSWADFKHSKDLKKTDGTKWQRLVGLTKLEDANEAGSRNSKKCTLILTEGDSAKALAVSNQYHTFIHLLSLYVKCHGGHILSLQAIFEAHVFVLSSYYHVVNNLIF